MPAMSAVFLSAVIGTRFEAAVLVVGAMVVMSFSFWGLLG